ncbi:hypothetical protein HN011_000883 [Eciton burchellii]|nr:hypothetical protein HN011_000883 [Eciton burchellii]
MKLSGVILRIIVIVHLCGILKYRGSGILDERSSIAANRDLKRDIEANLGLLLSSRCRDLPLPCGNNRSRNDACDRFARVILRRQRSVSLNWRTTRLFPAKPPLREARASIAADLPRLRITGPIVVGRRESQRHLRRWMLFVV